MELQSNVIFFVEIIGTVAFASSGAMVAVRKKLDLFGIIVLGVITAVGGGMLRDLMIGNIPPNMFRNPVYVFAAFLTVIVLFVLFRLRPSLLGRRQHPRQLQGMEQLSYVSYLWARSESLGGGSEGGGEGEELREVRKMRNPLPAEAFHPCGSGACAAGA